MRSSTMLPRESPISSWAMGSTRTGTSSHLQGKPVRCLTGTGVSLFFGDTMNIRPIIIAALQAVGLSIAGFLVPVLGQIAVLFVPVPLITVTVLHGRRAGVSATIIAAALVALIVSLHAAVILFVLALGCMALAMAA